MQLAAIGSPSTRLPAPLFPRPGASAAARLRASTRATPFPGPKRKGHSSITRVVCLHGVAPQRSAGPTPPTPVQITAAVANAKVVVELHVEGSEGPMTDATVADTGDATASSPLGGDDVPDTAGCKPTEERTLFAIAIVGTLSVTHPATPEKR